VDIVIAIAASITARTSKRGIDQGTCATSVGVHVDAVGTAAARGYELVPRRARPTAWWGFVNSLLQNS
jgi:hypothetical protein